MSAYDRFANAASHLGVVVLVAAVTGMLVCIVAMSVYTIRRGRDTGRRGRVLTDHNTLFPFMRSLRRAGQVADVSKRKILFEKDSEITDESLVDGTATRGERLMQVGIVALMTCFFLVFVGVGLWMLKSSPIGLVFPVAVGFWFFGNMRTFRRDREKAKARVAARRAGVRDPASDRARPSELQEKTMDDDEPSTRRGNVRAPDRSSSFFARNFLIIFGAIFLLVGVGALVGAVYDFKLEQRYTREGATAEGVVLTHSVHTAHHAGRRGRVSTQTYYDVTYRFQMPDGTTRQGADSLNSDLWNRLREQGPVTIQYLADDPSTNRVANPSRQGWVAVLLLSALGGIFAVIGGAVLAYDVRRRFKAAGA